MFESQNDNVVEMLDDLLQVTRLLSIETEVQERYSFASQEYRNSLKREMKLLKSKLKILKRHEKLIVE